MSAAVHRRSTLPNHARLVQEHAADVPRVLRALGLPVSKKGARWLILCPVHGDKSPSCGVFLGRNDGRIAARCWSCGWTCGDVVGLVAAVHRLDVRDGRQYREALDLAAAAVGLTLDHGQPGAGLVGPAPAPPPRPVAPVAPAYPPADEVADLWARCVPAQTDPDIEARLARRAIDPGAVDLYELARALPPDATLPRWARGWGASHRLIVPAYSPAGELRGLRARRTTDDPAQPKVRLPAGYTGDGLVMACNLARDTMTTGQRPGWLDALTVVVVEGEPDFLTWAAGVSDANVTPPAVLGLFSGSWSDDLAARLPDGSSVHIRTHDDAAGLKYGAAVYASLAGRYAAGLLSVHVSDALATMLEQETP